VDPAAGKLVQASTGLTLSTISASSGATASAIVSPAVPVPCEQAVPFPSAIFVLDGQAATLSQEMFIPSLIYPKKTLNSQKTISPEKKLKSQKNLSEKNFDKFFQKE
jgi:hypothetical protein